MAGSMQKKTELISGERWRALLSPRFRREGGTLEHAHSSKNAASVFSVSTLIDKALLAFRRVLTRHVRPHEAPSAVSQAARPLGRRWLRHGFVAGLLLLVSAPLSAQMTIVIDPKNANSALRNNAPIQSITYTIDGDPVIQNASAVSNTAVNFPVFATSITVNPSPGDENVGDETVIFFNDIAAQVRNNNFVSTTGPNLGVYNTVAPTRVTIVDDGLAAFEATVADASLNNNILNYLFYDGTLQNMPNASTADFDLLYYHAFTTDDYLVVGERDGNTFFALVPLGADGKPIPNANTLQFSPSPRPGTGLGHDWNTGYINANDDFDTQPMYFTVASIEKFFEGTSVPDQLVYGYRIDNNGNADVKFFGASETPFTDNPTNPLLTPGSIGNFVWFDTDLDGIQDPGEPGINGVTVNLLDIFGNPVLDSQGTPISTVTADDGIGNPGFYEFTGVFPGDYQVEFVAPPQYRFTLRDQGSDDALDSDADPSTGRTDVFTLDAEEDITTLDAGLVDASFIGDFVWVDSNANGIQDPAETGLNGVVVNLLDGNGDPVLDGFGDAMTTVTANDGNGEPGFYQFGNLDGGTYIVEFVLPSGFAFTQQNADGGGILGSGENSDADPITGRTGTFTIGLGSGTLNVDAGLVSDLQITKTSDAGGPLNPGDTLTYTIVVTNNGLGTISGVTVDDPLPEGVTYLENGVSAVVFPEPASGTQTLTFTDSGSSPFEVPAGVTSVTVEVWGGGGRGGSASGGGTLRRGGGGGGAFSRSVLSVNPGDSLAYSVGLGSTTTAAGGDSWFASESTIRAKGGNSVNTGTAGATGGSAVDSIGDVTYSGGNGADGAGLASGGGGSSAGTDAAGNNAVGSIGGIAPAGGGAGGNGKAGSNGDGLPGNVPGGGGGGAWKTRGNAQVSGGSGENGQLRITWEATNSGSTSAPPDLATGWALEPGATLTVTFAVTIGDNPPSQITNTAFVTSDINDVPLSASVTDSGGNPTAVTLGDVDLLAVSVSRLLGDIGALETDDAGLRALLETWDPAVAAGLKGADRAALLGALSEYLDPDGDGRVAVLRWETLEEIGTMGFYVDRRDGRDWTRINNTMLPAMVGAHWGGEYWLADPGARPGGSYQYRLIEIEARGTTQEYGPFDLRMGGR